ncbi:unnamed protein product [Ectocarpus sp. CCAP 1310/34]|nr:unnamed protein product [Ectocarpus sp. CCAP 1310/34]
MERLDITRRFKGRCNYFNVYRWSDKAAALRMVGAWGSEMGVGVQLCGAVRAKINGHDWTAGPLRLVMSGEGLLDSAAKYDKGLLNPPTEERARLPRQENGRVANDGRAWLVPAGLVLAGDGTLQIVTWETYIWRTGDPHLSSRELHEAILPLGFLRGLVFSRGSTSLNQKLGGTFTDEQRRRGARTATVDGAKVRIPMAVVEGNEAPTPLQQRTMDQRSEDSSRGDNNSVGAGPNENKATAKRRDIPIDAGDEGGEETGNKPAVKTLTARGLCLGYSALGLVANLQTAIDLDTGAIKVNPSLWCEKPKFGERGLTKRESEWKLNESGSMILGEHNSNGTVEHPGCQVGGTVPVVWDKVGGRWLVPKWALPYVKAGNVIRRGTNNRQHNGANQRYSAKRAGWK